MLEEIKCLMSNQENRQTQVFEWDFWAESPSRTVQRWYWTSINPVTNRTSGSVESPDPSPSGSAGWVWSFCSGGFLWVWTVAPARSPWERAAGQTVCGLGAWFPVTRRTVRGSYHSCFFLCTVYFVVNSVCQQRLGTSRHLVVPRIPFDGAFKSNKAARKMRSVHRSCYFRVFKNLFV